MCLKGLRAQKSMKTDQSLFGVGIRFGAPFSRDLRIHEFDAKEIVAKTRDTHCSQCRRRQNKFACMFTVSERSKVTTFNIS